MRHIVSQHSMVSRSLEKMTLIAVGLTTAVLVGVPVLLYAMNTLNNASQLERAEHFADQVHNLVNSTDTGISNDTTIQVNIPTGVSITASDATLTIIFQQNDLQTITWVETYTHQISLDTSDLTGSHFLTVMMVDGEIIVRFQPINT